MPNSTVLPRRGELPGVPLAPHCAFAVLFALTTSVGDCVPATDCFATATCPEPDAALPVYGAPSEDVTRAPPTQPSSAIDSGTALVRERTAGEGGEADLSSPSAVKGRAGSSECPSSLLPCGAYCVDASSDVANCGGCGVKCPSIGNSVAVCREGACVTECVGGSQLCGSTCVDLQSDLSNCSACGVKCAAPHGGTSVCEGTCKAKCSADAQLCGGQCVPRNATDHCGDCDRRCDVPLPLGSGTVSCSAGACRQDCNDGRLLCDGVCCAAPGPNRTATCEDLHCASKCIVPPLYCADGSRPCAGWNFESRQPEGWAVYPYQASAWDRAPLVSVDGSTGRALGAGFDGNGTTKWLLSLEVPLCADDVVDLRDKVVHAKVGLRSAPGYTLTGSATAELWTTEQVVSPTLVSEGALVPISGAAAGPANSISVEFKIDQPWKGWVIIDDVYIE